MSLVTRCPRCKTLFRVAPGQLQARAGQVRCGRCMNVFDGFQALAIEQPNAGGTSLRVAPEHGPAPYAAAAPDAVSAAPALPLRPAVVPVAPRASTAPAARTPPVAARPLRPRAPFSGILQRELPLSTQWAAACALLGILLIIQLAYVFRSDLAARYPALRSVL